MNAAPTQTTRTHNAQMSPEPAKLLQKYLARTWAAFIATALLGSGIGNEQEDVDMLYNLPVGYMIRRHGQHTEKDNKTKTDTKQ